MTNTCEKITFLIFMVCYNSIVALAAPSEMECSRKAGEVALASENRGEAEKHYQDYLKMAEESDSKLDQALAHKFLGNTLIGLPTKLKEARSHYEKAAALAKICHSTTDLADISYDLAALDLVSVRTSLKQSRYFQNDRDKKNLLKQLDSAENRCNQSIQLMKRLGVNAGLEDRFVLLSQICLNRLDIERAKSPDSDGSKEPPDYGKASIYLASAEALMKPEVLPLLERGNLNYRQGNYQQALAVYGACVDKASRYHQPRRQAEALRNSAMALRSLSEQNGTKDHLVKAISDLGRAAALLEEMREGIGLDTFAGNRSGFFSDNMFIFEQLIDLCVQVGKQKEAFEWIQKAKARALQDLFEKQEDTPLEEKKSPSFDYPKISEQLGDDADLLEFFIGDSGVFRCLFTRDSALTVEKLPMSSLDLIKLIQDYRGKCSRGVGTVADNGFSMDWQEEGNSIFKILVGDIWDRLKLLRILVVCPHHVLHYLPFDALPVARTDNLEGYSDKAPRFWVEEGPAVTYAPSASVFASIADQNQPTIKKISLFVNNDLVAEKQLLDRINVIIAKQASTVEVSSFTRETMFTKAVFLKEWGKTDFLHLGSHGSLNLQDPLQSHLVFRDGVLTTKEVFALTGTGPKFLVLAACQSGLADPMPQSGDDLLGLSRAFLARGVRSLVATLWSVPDRPCPEIETAYFDGLLNHSLDGPEALKSALKDFLANARDQANWHKDDGLLWQYWAHPFWWAAFIHIGDYSPPAISRNESLKESVNAEP